MKVLDVFGLKTKVTENPKKILGVCTVYNEDGAVTLHQDANVRQLIKTQGLENAKPCATPMDPATDSRRCEEGRCPLFPEGRRGTNLGTAVPI
jgi:hypothetical protein